MTNIKIILSDAATGTWTVEGTSTVVATGVRLGGDRDPWAVADALAPSLLALGTTGRVEVDAVDPTGTDIMGGKSEDGELICSFTVEGGQVTSYVPRAGLEI